MFIFVCARMSVLPMYPYTVHLSSILHLANILPPPHDLSLAIVKLLSHKTYRFYQSQIATLSLFPSLHLKFLPPAWNAPTPPTPGKEVTDEEGKEKKEWKRRIKMYRA